MRLYPNRHLDHGDLPDLPTYEYTEWAKQGLARMPSAQHTPSAANPHIGNNHISCTAG